MAEDARAGTPLPPPDSLSLPTLLWLQGEFRATRETAVTGIEAVNQRLDDHLSAGHPVSGKRRAGALVSIVLSVATIIGAFFGGFSQGHQ